MIQQIDLIEIVEENLAGEGCFCLRSKQSSNGYINKNNWLKEKLNDGLKYVKVMENGKQAGFIEYIPIESSSRVVYGENYLIIHCLWISITGKGYATKLINQCIEDAKEQKKDGVVVITNSDTSWTPSKDIFVKNGFKEIEQAPYGFELLVHKFGDSPDPYFPIDWDERLKRFTNLTVLQTYQCPYVEVATDNVIQAANKLGIEAELIELTKREDILKLSPTPYGIYGVIYKNQLISYHRLTVHSSFKKLKELNEV